MNIEKKLNLLKIKKEIEKMCDEHTKPLATIQEICECFNELLENKSFRTTLSEVANWYSQFDFINITNTGYIHYVITYVNCCYIVKGLNCYGYHLDKVFENEEQARQYLERKKAQEGVLSLSFYINSKVIESYESRGLKLVRVI